MPTCPTCNGALTPWGVPAQTAQWFHCAACQVMWLIDAAGDVIRKGY